MPWPRRNRSKPVLPAHQWQGLSLRQRIARWFRPWRPWIVLALLLAAVHYLGSPLFDRLFPPAPPAVVEPVNTRFFRCGQGHGPNCVVDGDTFHIGPRRIRVAGIDAPELHPARCPDEARLGEAAAARLLALLNQGPFTLTSPNAAAFDEYGRELRSVTRTAPGGKVWSIADAMIASQTVRPFLRGQRGTWCPVAAP